MYYGVYPRKEYGVYIPVWNTGEYLGAFISWGYGVIVVRLYTNYIHKIKDNIRNTYRKGYVKPLKKVLNMDKSTRG